ncbi:MAG: DNA replication and repair protein RecF, partial [Rhodothermales bacterium]
MYLRTLRLMSFRAHDRTECGFTPSVNLIHGPNGAGKTNLLEAIHFLCLSKGFVTSQDRYVVRKGAGHLEVEGHFQRDDGRNLRVRMAYVPGEGKRIFVNGAPLERLSDIVGQLPVVVYSPQDHVLTAGGPEERRRLIDNILSQARPLYLDTLIRYRRALKQRNSLLLRLQEQRGPSAAAALEPWNVELIELGSRIIASRAQFVRAFSEYLERAYREIESVAERPTLTYDALTSGADPEDISGAFRQALAESASRERRRGLTLVGPHRDELVFRLDSMLVRRYASQGQHRTFGMALKLAKYFY